MKKNCTERIVKSEGGRKIFFPSGKNSNPKKHSKKFFREVEGGTIYQKIGTMVNDVYINGISNLFVDMFLMKAESLPEGLQFQ